MFKTGYYEYTKFDSGGSRMRKMGHLIDLSRRSPLIFLVNVFAATLLFDSDTNFIEKTGISEKQKQ